MAGVSLPTVDRWVERYQRYGLAGLEEHKRGGAARTGSGAGRGPDPGLTPDDAAVGDGTVALVEPGDGRLRLTRRGGLGVLALCGKLWRDNDLRPHRQGTFKLSRDPRFADKVADIVGLYLDPPAGAVVLSYRREDTDPGVGPHAAVAAAGFRGDREAHP